MRIIKSNSKKHGGFGLIEVVISMMILAIISMSVYNGYIMLIKQTKAGQVKQTAALEGKKAIEEIQAAIKDNNFNVYDSKLEIGTTEIQRQPTDINGVYTRYFNEKYEACSKEDSKYVQKITVTPTKVADNTNVEKTIELDTNYESNLKSNKIYISKIGSKNYISYWTYSEGNAFIPDTDNEIPSSSESDTNKINIYIYLEPIANDPNNESIQIKDYKGQPLLSTTKGISENFVINFSNYKTSDGSLPINADIEINMYNKTSTISNVYIEKQKDLNVNVKARKGGINIYDNRTENVEQGKFGYLYDIKVQINKDSENLFTGYSKKNIEN